MIEEYYTGTPISQLCSSAPSAPSVALQTPTIQKNSVIVLRVSRNDYDLDDMNTLRDYYQKLFPNNTVAVMFDDIEMHIVNDNSWHKRPCAEVSDGYSYN